MLKSILASLLLNESACSLRYEEAFRHFARLSPFCAELRERDDFAQMFERSRRRAAEFTAAVG